MNEEQKQDKFSDLAEGETESGLHFEVWLDKEEEFVNVNVCGDQIGHVLTFRSVEDFFEFVSTVERARETYIDRFHSDYCPECERIFEEMRVKALREGQTLKTEGETK